MSIVTEDKYKVRIIYLASPFFSESQIIRENTICSKLRELGYVVIRPKELGILSKSSTSEERNNIMRMDLEAINKSDAVFCITNDKDMGCFEGSTKIKLMSGESIPIKDMTMRDEGYWVYSVNKETNEIEPGFTYGSVLSKKNAKLVKITLDNDEEIICTPDHPFMIRDKSYKNAEDLRVGESLMPLYLDESGHYYDPFDDSLGLFEGEKNPCYGKKMVTHPPTLTRKFIPKDSVQEFLETNKDWVLGFNHSVKSVEYLDYTSDVYGIQVDDNHNYALDAGVFVSNTMVEAGYAIAKDIPVIYYAGGLEGPFNVMLAASGVAFTDISEITRENIDKAISDHGSLINYYGDVE